MNCIIKNIIINFMHNIETHQQTLHNLIKSILLFFAIFFYEKIKFTKFFKFLFF